MLPLPATLAVALSAAVLALAQAPPEGGAITPGVAWTDTSGNRVYAGGADVVYEAGRFWMVGEGNKTMQDCSECFNLYSSARPLAVPPLSVNAT